MNKYIICILAVLLIVQPALNQVVEEVPQVLTLNVKDAQTDFKLFLKGFTMGFIGEDLSGIENCASATPELLSLFSDISNDFLKRNKDAYIEGYKKILILL